MLRGLAASLVASLTGCGFDVRPSDTGPDGGTDRPDAPSPGFAKCAGGVCLDLSDPANAVLREVDGARVIAFDARRVVVIRISETSFLALSAICTHSGCTVRYAPARGDIECPCHGSTFALDGSVTSGPADAPLAQFATTFDASSELLTIAV